LKGAQLQLLIWKTVEYVSRNAGRSPRPWEESMIMTDDATSEELWRRLAEESPHASDDEIERLFIAAAKDNEDFIRQITEWVQ
jgi:hypothetical protein